MLQPFFFELPLSILVPYRPWRGHRLGKVTFPLFCLEPEPIHWLPKMLAKSFFDVKNFFLGQFE